MAGFKIAAASSLFLLFVNPLGIAVAETSAAAAHWQSLGTADLTYMHDTLEDSHPGKLDVADDNFNKWHTAGYNAALQKMKHAKSLAEMLTTLKYYAAGFADGHLGVQFDYVPDTLSWPGFVVGRRGNGAVVVYQESEKARPKAGERLGKCDGRAAEDIIKQDILPFTNGNDGLESTLIKNTPRLFVDGAIAGRKRLTECLFSSPSSSAKSSKAEETKILLSWVSIDGSELIPRLRNAVFGPQPKFTNEEYSPGRHWISIPTFTSDDEAEKQGLHNAIAAVAKLKNAKSIVLDVRRNNGGNSAWGQQIFESIYGRNHIQAVQLKNEARGLNGQPDWRVSKGNIAFLESREPGWRKDFGTDSETYREFTNLTVAMKAALKKKIPFVPQSPEPEVSATKILTPSPAQSQPPAPEVNAQVVVLTDGSCASACLDFLDLARTIPGVIHAGQQTSADTLYMDIRSERLPSGLGEFVFPMKVYRHRARGNKVSYMPKWKYDGDLSDTQRVKNWLASLMK